MQSFFPVSEYQVELLFGGSGNNSIIHFYDISNPQWTDRSYKHIDVGQAVRFQLVLPADGPRKLELTYYDHPRKGLEVSIDDQSVAIIGGGNRGWQTAQLTVPSRVGTIVQVTVKIVGQEAGAIAEAVLTE